MGHFLSTMENDARYQRVEKHDVPQYMLPYITRIFCEEDLYTEFRLLPEHFPDISLFESQFDPGCAPILTDIYLCCFATGCLFMEFRIRYDRSDLDQIADFSFRFKNANSIDRDQPGKVRMIDAIQELLPQDSGATVFPGSSSFKNDCKMFHQIFLEEALPEAELERHLVHLRRGYHREFPVPNTDDGYDMIFRPYEYDHWSGSQEGLVDLYHITDNKAANSYLTKYKPIQLSVSYRFMYLVLLDQRYSAIVLLGKIPHFASYTRADRERMSFMISHRHQRQAFQFSVQRCQAVGDCSVLRRRCEDLRCDRRAELLLRRGLG